jgi:hypothetical protein
LLLAHLNIGMPGGWLLQVLNWTNQSLVLNQLLLETYSIPLSPLYQYHSSEYWTSSWNQHFITLLLSCSVTVTYRALLIWFTCIILFGCILFSVLYQQNCVLTPTVIRYLTIKICVAERHRIFYYSS